MAEGQMVRLSIPGNECIHCGAIMGAALRCPGCGHIDPLTRSVTDTSDGYRAGDTYSYRSVTTFEIVTWTRDADGVWSSPDRTMTCDDAEIDKQRALDKPEGGSEPGVGTFTSAAAQEPCALCEARHKAIANGSWSVGFRWCPWCGAKWR